MCSFLIRDLKQGSVSLLFRFINVLNLDRLIENLKTIWIGRFHLSANTARFERPKASTFQKEKPVPSGNVTGFKQPIVQNQGRPKESYLFILKPSLVFRRLLPVVEQGSLRIVSGLEVLTFSSIKALRPKRRHLGKFKLIVNGKRFFGAVQRKETFVWFSILQRCSWFRSSNMVSSNDKGMVSSGPFNIYNLLDKHTKEVRTTDTSTTIPYPPGFTPATYEIPACNNQNILKQNLIDLPLVRTDSKITGSRQVCGFVELINPLAGRVYFSEFFRKYWTVVGPDFCIAVKWFFDHGDFAIGCNSSFVALIPKVLDPKVVSDYRPISLIGSLYKVVTKILASRLSLVISDLISDVQTAFLPNRQILDGPFIINEILARCKLKKQQAMIFKVDFAKAYDSVRWDYLDDVLISFGFGPKWRSWIRGSLSSGKASILVNGSPTTEFHLYRGLKQGDPLAPFLFLLIMESLHLSFSRAVEAGIFKGYKIDPSTTLSHLFYADDAVFIGEWSHSNLKGIMNILRCFSLLSGMSINIQKSHLLGVGIPDNCVAEAAKSIGCLIMKAPFKYLGILVGDNMSSKKAWDETINKMKKRLSRWKLNTLSVGGRLTLLKSVLGSTPIYNMSIFKVPKSVLNYMESLRRNFFNGFQEGDRKIAWVKWSKVLASKKFGGLGVSSFFALNRALLFKWVWRYLSHDNSLWSRIISALHGLNGHVLSAAFNSTWSSIITEVNSLKVKGVDLISHCKIRVGKGTGTSFWKDLWIGDNLLKLSFPRLFALEENKDISVADKMNTSISSSFRRHVRGGVESQQLDQLSLLLDTVILSNMDDRWFWDLNGDGVFLVKDVRSMLDEAFLPKMEVPTRWIKSIPIKVNVFAWKLYLDRLPTRSNLSRRNVSLPSLACPLCDHVLEDSSHLFFGCSVAKDIQKLICRWWNLDVHPYESYEDWLSWFKSIRLGEFSVKFVRQLIDDSILPKEKVSTRWVTVMPIKINVFAWRVCLDKLSTRLNLSLTGIDISTIVCPLCHAYIESGSHIFFYCSMARHLWRKLMRWWELEGIDLASYDDWLLWINSSRLSKRLKEILKGVCYVMWWLIWRFKNQLLFGATNSRMELLFNNLVQISFNWCSNRCNSKLNCVTWMKNPCTLCL
ncbi:RNA-directed DNA polymerase, eukaryota [Tanacetum coccineum]